MTDNNCHIIQVTDESELQEAAALFSEYANSLPFELDFQDFEAELAGLPGKYKAPDGCIMLAQIDNKAAGCVALRQIGPGICEMKRLYVRPAFRSSGVARLLVTELIARARDLKYEKMRLDTVASMQGAIALYEKFRFIPTQAYCENPFDDALFMELDLREHS